MAITNTLTDATFFEVVLPTLKAFEQSGLAGAGNYQYLSLPNIDAILETQGGQNGNHPHRGDPLFSAA